MRENTRYYSLKKLRDKDQKSDKTLRAGVILGVLIFLSFFVLFMVVSQVFLKKQKQIYFEKAITKFK